jgi:hypothetical protein
MKTINITILSLLASFAISCGPAKVLNNYATTTEEIFKLEKGMSVSDVNSVLKSEPKDIYSTTAGQTKVLVYKYRHGYQKVPTSTRNNENYLRGGTPVYKEEASLYAVFDAKTNELIYYITDSGRKMGQNELNEALKLKLKSVK